MRNSLDNRIKLAFSGSAFGGLAGSAAGAYAGDVLADLLVARMGLSPRLQRPVQVVASGLGGLLGSRLATPSDEAPTGYRVDPTVRDIPDWATSGAQFFAPAMKTGAAERWHDIIFGEVPGYPLVEGFREQGARGAGKAFLGSALGGMAMGIPSYLAGKLVSHLAGRDLNVPGINMPLSHLMGAFGGTIGATKGLQRALGVSH